MSRKRRRQERETTEFGAMVSRMLRAYGRRVGDGDPVDMVGLVALRVEVEEAIAAAVAGQRAAGFSWREIADGLGVTREAAFMRFRSSTSASDTRVG